MDSGSELWIPREFNNKELLNIQNEVISEDFHKKLTKASSVTGYYINKDNIDNDQELSFVMSEMARDYLLNIEDY